MACEFKKWRSPISLKEEKRDWEGLERKLSRGKLLEKAAEESGIPLEEAQIWLANRRETHSYDDDSLRILSAKALVSGMNALIRASQEKDGRIKGEGGTIGSTYEYSDVDAAKALVMAGLKVRSMIGARKEPEKKTGEQDDLFDRAWNFPTQK